MKMNRKTGFWIALWLILVVVTGVLAFGSGNGNREFGWHHGWNYMDGSNHGYQSEAAPGWYGMGPSITRGAGSGYGMGSFHGMTGYDMPGIAYGMMSWMQQNMTPEQAKKAAPLLDDVGTNTRKLMQQRVDALAKLSSLYTSDKRDWNAIRAAANELAELNSQQTKAALEMQQKMDGLLSDKQRVEMSYVWRNNGKSGDQ
jgi:Spy/CpxP family protein refolding chaperone